MLATTLSSASGGEDVCIMLGENRVVNTYVVIIFAHYICDWQVGFQYAGHPPQALSGSGEHGAVAECLDHKEPAGAGTCGLTPDEMRWESARSVRSVRDLAGG
ncbi:hypothetical protein AA303_07400 [Pseudomonas psychrophila]|nr:hypothetical protein AA303_07400 [Pseudomonas psychrophila]